MSFWGAALANKEKRQFTTSSNLWISSAVIESNVRASLEHLTMKEDGCGGILEISTSEADVHHPLPSIRSCTSSP